VRPPGELRRVLLTSAAALVRTLPDGSRRGGTIREIAEKAGVGYDAATLTVRNMKRSGDLEIAAKREVPYRNGPVAEYVPPPPEGRVADGYVDLGRLVAVWR
jgi:hypothetical protein